MKDLWYFEQRSMSGDWVPCTTEDYPATVNVNGDSRLKRVDGTVGPTIRHVTLIKPEMRSAPLAELQAALKEL